MAVQVSLDNGAVGEAGIALTAVGPTNLRRDRGRGALRGREPTEEAIADAARLAAEAARPAERATAGRADYKRNVVRVYVERGLRDAVAAARGGDGG